MSEGELFTQEHALKVVRSVRKKIGAVMMDLGGEHPHFRALCHAKGSLMTLDKFIKGEEQRFSIMDIEGPEAKR